MQLTFSDTKGMYMHNIGNIEPLETCSDSQLTNLWTYVSTVTVNFKICKSQPICSTLVHYYSEHFVLQQTT